MIFPTLMAWALYLRWERSIVCDCNLRVHRDKVGNYDCDCGLSW
jgi:hypothetical protein